MFVSQLEVLEATGLVQLAQSQPEPEYLFRHALVQEAAYQSLFKEDRKRLHRTVGQVIERLFPERLEELAATLAHHFSQAVDDRRALKYFVLAGDVAFRQHAVREAVTYYSRALELAKRLDGMDRRFPWQQVYTNLGRALELDAQYEPALELYIEMEQRARSLADRAMELVTVMERAKIRSTPNPTYDRDQGRVLAERAMALALELNDRPAEARIYWIRMLASWLQGDREEALVHGERSLTMARALNLREQLAYTLQDLQRAYLLNDQAEAAERALDEACVLWRQLDNLPMLADALASSADLRLRKGEYEAALELAHTAFRLSQSIGNLWNLAFSRGMMGEVYLARGLMGQSLEALQEAIRLSERAGLTILAVRAQLYRLSVLILLGAIEPARRMAEQMLSRIDTFQGFGFPFDANVWWLVAQLEIRAGDLEAARSAVEIAQQILQAEGIENRTFRLTQVELALELGEYDAVVTMTSQLAEAIHTTSLRASLPRTLYCLGLAQLKQGSIEAAAQTLHQALNESQNIGNRHYAWRALAALAELDDLRGDRAGAAAWRLQSRQIIEYIAEHIHSAELRAAFLDQPGVRAVLEPAEPSA